MIIYSYEEGILTALQIIAIVSIYALISTIISLIIGIRKKDCIVIFTGNIMVKTVIIFLCQILYNLLDSDNSIIELYIELFIALIFSIIFIEGFIYDKILKYKEYGGMTVSTICNIGTVIIIFMFFYICSKI